jgi:hypothetical protein
VDDNIHGEHGGGRLEAPPLLVDVIIHKESKEITSNIQVGRLRYKIPRFIATSYHTVASPDGLLLIDGDAVDDNIHGEHELFRGEA